MKINDKLFAFTMYLPALVFLSIFLLYPLGFLVYTSIYECHLLRPEEKIFIGLGNYVQVLGSTRFGGAVRNTVVYTGLAVSVEFLIGFGVALLLNTGFRGNRVMRTIFLLPLMLAPVIVGLMWRFILADQYGILNWTLFRLKLLPNPSSIFWLSNKKIVLFSCVIVDIWLTTPFMMLILLAGLQSLPVDIFEVAKVDGASLWQVFRHITLPLLKPVIAVALIIRVIDASRTFDIVWILTKGGPAFASELISTYIYRVFMRFLDAGIASAMAIIFLGILLSISLFFFLYIWKRKSQV